MSDRTPEQVIADAYQEFRSQIVSDVGLQAFGEIVARRLRAAGLLPGPDDIVVPRRFVDEVVLALDAATTISMRWPASSDGLHIGNHDRLIREAQQWSSCARNARSLPAQSQPHPAQEQQT